MSLHPPRLVDLGSPFEDQPEPAPAPRASFVWHGVTIERRFAQRPRVHRLEVTKHDPRKGAK